MVGTIDAKGGIFRTLVVLLIAAAPLSLPKEALADDRLDFTALGDLNKTGLSSGPFGFTQIGTSTYFGTAHYNLGAGNPGVWVSEGAGSPRMLSSTPPAASVDGEPTFMVLGARVMYRAGRGDNNWQALWRTNATAEGTAPLLDPSTNKTLAFGPLTRAGDQIFFAGGPGSDPELWTTDGTPDGTRLVADLEPGSVGSNPREMTQLGGDVIFTARSTVDGVQLWRSDGTAEGTRVLKTFGLDATKHSLLDLERVGGAVVFTVGDSSAGRELWVTDGTADGTRLLKGFTPGSLGSELKNLTRAGERAYFAAGPNLWATDGTEAGTQLIRALPDRHHRPSNFERVPTLLGETIYFSGPGDSSVGRLWRTDGTADGTRPVDGPDGPIEDPRQLTALGFDLYFSFSEEDRSYELWKVPSLSETAVPAGDIGPPRKSARVTSLAAIGGQLHFAADDRTHGHELWTAGPGPIGPALLADLNRRNHSSGPEFPTPLGSSTFFSADDGVNGEALWETNGTEAGTRLVEAHPPNHGNFREVVRLGDQIVYSTSTSIWASDVGGTGVTKLVDGDVQQLTTVGDKVFFQIGLWDIWQTDGTVSGTKPAVLPGAGGRIVPDSLVEFQGSLFFGMDNRQTDRAYLWKSDGTEAGTELVARVTEATQTTVMGDRLVLFGTEPSILDRSLWVSDGTSEGTERIFAFDPRDSRYGPEYMTSVGNRVFFTIALDDVDEQLWVTDGTSEGTRQLTDVPAYAPYFVTRVGGSVVFTATDGEHGFEPWISDGTVAGTHMIEDVVPGRGGSGPRSFAAVGRAVYFEVSGDLWKADESGESAVRVETPFRETITIDGTGSSLFFAAGDPEFGTEPWIATDTTLPDTSITSGPEKDQQVADPSPTFGFAADELATTFECRFDDEAWRRCSGPGPTDAPLTPLEEGDHTFAVRATDAFANVDSTPAERAFEYRVPPPETEITAGPNPRIRGTSTAVSFDAVANADPSTFECSLDGAEFARCESPATLTSLEDGAHEFRVQATDAEGRVDPTPAVVSFEVDNSISATIDVEEVQRQRRSGPLKLHFALSAEESLEASVSGYVIVGEQVFHLEKQTHAVSAGTPLVGSLTMNRAFHKPVRRALRRGRHLVAALDFGLVDSVGNLSIKTKSTVLRLGRDRR